ncbi:MAG: M20/M25/M40 family metallo-hydrolase [Bacteroidetes bacterium]|nr:M20/M25/M40 family metallo-hydrolase [Bacteroidota bacterium]
MKYILAIVVFLSFSFYSQAQKEDSLIIRKIFDESLEKGEAYNHLRVLCKNIGNRLSGSPQAEAAVRWTEKSMKDFGADTVFKQDVMVPHWQRGEREKATIFPSKSRNIIPLNVLALGGSVGTGNSPLLAGVTEVESLEALDNISPEAIKGKIVFLNERMDAKKANTFEAYDNAFMIRWACAVKTAPLGAIAVIIRSVNPSLDDFPHTGVMNYADSVQKIPACAISTNDAEKLSLMLKKDPSLKIKLEMHCKMLPDAPSYNVVGQLNGSEFKDEYLVVGGHLDSWDIGEGAHDDGAGVVQSMEVLNLLKKAGVVPRHNIRAVAFMNEENGNRGGKKYAELSLQNKEKHIAAIESDAGGFTPRGFFMKGDSLQREKILKWKHLFAPYMIHSFELEGGGVDIGPLLKQNTFLLGLFPDTQRYFDIHHNPNDVFENVNRRELQLGAATMAAMIYLIDKYGL